MNIREEKRKRILQNIARLKTLRETLPRNLSQAEFVRAKREAMATEVPPPSRLYRVKNYERGEFRNV